MRDVNCRLLTYARKGDLNSVLSALDAGADINVQDKWGYTALMLMTIYGCTKMIDKFIRADADINIQNADGWTALMWAASYGRTGIADILIQAGADMFIKNKNGRTTLDIAKKHNRRETTELIKQRMAEQKNAELEHNTTNAKTHDISRWL